MTFEDGSVEMDPNLFEDLFDIHGDSARQRNKRTPLCIPEDVLDELLRSIQQQKQHFQTQRQQRDRNAHNQFKFYAFKIWQNLNDSGTFH